MNKLGIFVNFWEKKWSIDYRYYIDKMGTGLLILQICLFRSAMVA